MNVRAKFDYVFGDEQWIVKGNVYKVDEVLDTSYVIDGQIYHSTSFEVVSDSDFYLDKEYNNRYGHNQD